VVPLIFYLTRQQCGAGILANDLLRTHFHLERKWSHLPRKKLPNMINSINNELIKSWNG
jgi:hypothetical protein